MTILDYIDKYGNYSFDDLEFNEVDNVIFSSISYLELDNIVPHFMHSKISISDTAKIYFKWLNSNKKITAHKSAIEIFKKISKVKRYRDLKLYNYKYIGNREEQFCAVTIDITDKLSYLSFEGTDDLISGWKEDFYLACYFPVDSHRDAIHYANRFILTNKKLIFGGHSKGGNLALVAAMYASRFVKDNIVAVYSNDGPGLRKKEFESLEFKNILSKYHLIIPNYSFFGLLLRHDSYTVIKSSIKGIYAHDLLTWQVDDKSFKRVELSETSKLFEKSMFKWVNSYDDEDRISFVNSIFEIFDKLNITSATSILEHKTLLLKIIMESKLPKKTKKMQQDFIKTVLTFLVSK